MRVKNGAVVLPDHPVMKKAMKVAERIWKDNGRVEGITVTAGKDGIHSAGSWHYYGAAVDLRTGYEGRSGYPPESQIWSAADKAGVYDELKAALPQYDVVWHDSHIHVEPSDALAKKWGLLL